MEKNVIEVFLQYGVLGVVLLIVGWAYFKKDLELKEERAARIADARSHVEDAIRYGNTMVSLQEKVTTTANKLIDLAGIWERREQQRELAEAAQAHADDQQRREDRGRTAPRLRGGGGGGGE
jgi:hypothetical protein